MTLKDNTVFGFIKPLVDVHIMGMSTMANLLRDCGYKVEMAPSEVMKAVEDVNKINNFSLIKKWIIDNNISVLSFSYRLDPSEGCKYFCSLYHLLKDYKLLSKDGGPVEVVSFAGLPDTCKLIKQEIGNKTIYFPGNETPIDSLKRYGIPERLFPKYFKETHEYDKALWSFAYNLIESEKYKFVGHQDHYGYKDCGTDKDSFVKRLHYCQKHQSLPLIRVHAGPYLPDRAEAVSQYLSWVRQLAKTKLLDILSIGSSQLTQQHFGESWEGLHNGGGVPVNSEIEYKMIAQAAKPMLVRTYAGTKNVPWMAEMHERSLNISWHALSFWWFCELDGRGDNSVLENLKEHLETIKYIASTLKPLEPNVPHHFSFRGGDDITYIVTAYLAAKTAKLNGIKHLILQNMLNTPKYTWGVQDLAKSRALIKLVRGLEDNDFHVSLQCRAGLDYFSTNLEEAKVQLAAVTALMDDIEPTNPNSPEIIHVVSYSEAVRLATPDIIEESIKITLSALKNYRLQKSFNNTFNTVDCQEISDRFENLYEEAREAITFLEKHFPNLYTAEGLCKVYEFGFFPTPYIYDPLNKFPNATKWNTAFIDGGIRVINEKREPINTLDRYRAILGV